MEYHVKDRQAWLLRRLNRLDPSHFFEGTVFCAPPCLTLPPRFVRHWACIPDSGSGASITQVGRPSQEDPTDPNAIVIFASPSCPKDLEFLGLLVESIDAQGAEAPPMVWVPHTVEPSLRSAESVAALQDEHPVRVMIQNGLDGIVTGEPEGMSLPLAIRGRLSAAMAFANEQDDTLGQRRSRVLRSELLKDCIQSILWGYLRVRLLPCLPPLDPTMAIGLVRHLDGYQLGHRVGRGTYGAVFMLWPAEDAPDAFDEHRREASPGVAEVVKVVNKENIDGVRELQKLKHMIDVMQLLSSDRWKHPNVVQTYMIYHSYTHIFFRMEYGGECNLFHRLMYRSIEGPGRKPLNLDKAGSLISEALGVVSYLQLGPRVCHRDIKPENFVVGETADTIRLKLCDFDMALIQDRALLNTPCGTFPFAAPEVMLGHQYCGYSVDIWSLGVVLLEILCGNNVLEKSLNLESVLQKCGAARLDEVLSNKNGLGQKIVDAFEEPGRVQEMLQGRICPELQALTPWAQGFIERMLEVKPEDRCSAEDLRKYERALPAFTGEHRAPVRQRRREGADAARFQRARPGCRAP